MDFTITIDATDIDAQATFWCEALDYERLPAWVDFYLNLEPKGDAAGRPPILLQRVPEQKSVKNRLHLDLHPHDGPETVARLRDVGASLVGPINMEFFDEYGTQFQVMADPEGNEFCVIWRTARQAWD